MADPQNLHLKKNHFIASNAGKEALVLLFAFIVLTFFSIYVDLFEIIIELTGPNDDYEIDEILLTAALFSVLAAIFAMRRWMESRRLLREREYASIAIMEANAALSETTKELSAKQERNELLSQMISFLQVCKSKEEAFQFISESARSLFKDCSGALYIIKESRNQLHLAAKWGNSTQPELFTPDDCWGLRLGKRFVTSSSWKTPLCNHISADDKAIYVCYPLIAYGEITGLFHVVIQEMPGETDSKSIPASIEQTLLMFTEQVSLSISNLELHQKLKHLAIHDPLTGLYNRHYLEETFEREIHRAKRKNSKLGIIMMDIDHFKIFNDTYGHSAGDTVLKEFGRFINASFRVEDFCCRYGGEEFFVLLSDVDPREFREKCDKIRHDIENIQITYRDMPLKNITATIGAALYPEHGETASQLIESADKALYRGKKAGRNRVHFAGK